MRRSGCGDPPISPGVWRTNFDQARLDGSIAVPPADNQGVEARIVERLGSTSCNRGADSPSGLGQQTNLIDRLADLHVREFKGGDREPITWRPGKTMKPMRCMTRVHYVLKRRLYDI